MAACCAEPVPPARMYCLAMIFTVGFKSCVRLYRSTLASLRLHALQMCRPPSSSPRPGAAQNRLVRSPRLHIACLGDVAVLPFCDMRTAYGSYRMPWCCDRSLCLLWNGMHAGTRCHSRSDCSSDSTVDTRAASSILWFVLRGICFVLVVGSSRSSRKQQRWRIQVLRLATRGYGSLFAGRFQQAGHIETKYPCWKAHASHVAARCWERDRSRAIELGTRNGISFAQWQK